MSSVEEWKTSAAEMTYGADHILRCTILEREHTVAHAREGLALIAAQTKGRRFAMLLDIRQLASAEPEAQRHYAKGAPTGVVAMAMVVDSRWSRMIGNIALSVAALTRRASSGATLVPIRLFDDAPSAEQWCREMLAT